MPDDMTGRLRWHLAVVGEAGAVSRDADMSMRGRWGGRIVLAVKRKRVLLMTLGIERRRGRRLSRPIPAELRSSYPCYIIVDLRGAYSSYVFASLRSPLPSNVFVDAATVARGEGGWRCGGLSRPGGTRSEGVLSVRLGLFCGGVVWGLDVGLEGLSKRL